MKREPEDWPLAVVFDLDGTLVDSAADIADALNRTIALRGLAPFTLAEVKAMVGGGVPKLAERALIARGAAVAEVPAIVAGFVQFYRERLTAKTTLCEGAPEILERLQREGRRLGLCTNKQHELTVLALGELGIANYFPAVAGERDGHPRKPDPAPLLGVLSALGVAPGDAVMVGDSAADVDCAKAASVASVAVRGGYTQAPVEELGADSVIGSLKDLPACLASLRSKRAPLR
jgi:phosphoglycolate phosphatase